MKRFLRRDISRIYIMLGSACNMSCSYCLQHPLVHGQLAREIDPQIYDFLEQVAEENQSGRITLTFYGGEPLLYFAAIKELVQTTRSRGVSCSYGVISNGRAITEEITDFFNEHDFSVTISWDGFNTDETRGFDVFAIPELKARLLRLKNLGLSGVISARAYPLELLEAFQKLSDEYTAVQGAPLGVNLDEIMDTGLADRRLLAIDYNRIEKEMRLLAGLYLDNIVSGRENPGDYTKMAYLEKLFQTASNFYLKHDGRLQRQTSYCGNGLTVLNMDLNGNLYPCHNTDVKTGSISSGFFAYLQKILAGETLLRHREECLECPVLAFCKGGCKLVKDKTEYCRLKRALFLPVLEEFLLKGYELQSKKE